MNDRQDARSDFKQAGSIAREKAAPVIDDAIRTIEQQAMMQE